MKASFWHLAICIVVAALLVGQEGNKRDLLVSADIDGVSLGFSKRMVVKKWGVPSSQVSYPAGVSSLSWNSELRGSSVVKRYVIVDGSDQVVKVSGNQLLYKGSVLLKVGDRRERVIAALGLPDETSATTWWSYNVGPRSRVNLDLLGDDLLSLEIVIPEFRRRVFDLMYPQDSRPTPAHGWATPLD